MSDSSLTNEHEVSLCSRTRLPVVDFGPSPYGDSEGTLGSRIWSRRHPHEPPSDLSRMMPGDHSDEFKNTTQAPKKPEIKPTLVSGIRNPENPSEPPGTYEWMEEPIVKLEIITRSDMVGEMMTPPKNTVVSTKPDLYRWNSNSILTWRDTNGRNHHRFLMIQISLFWLREHELRTTRVTISSK